MTTEVITARLVALRTFRTHIGTLETRPSSVHKYFYFLGQHDLMHKDMTEGTLKFTIDDIIAASDEAKAAIAYYHKGPE